LKKKEMAPEEYGKKTKRTIMNVNSRRRGGMWKFGRSWSYKKLGVHRKARRGLTDEVKKTTGETIRKVVYQGASGGGAKGERLADARNIP